MDDRSGPLQWSQSWTPSDLLICAVSSSKAGMVSFPSLGPLHVLAQGLALVGSP